MNKYIVKNHKRSVVFHLYPMSSLSVFSAAVMMNGVLEFPRRSSGLDFAAAAGFAAVAVADAAVRSDPRFDTGFTRDQSEARWSVRADCFVKFVRVEFFWYP